MIGRPWKCHICTLEKDDGLVCKSCDNDPASDAGNCKEPAEKPEDTAGTGGNEQVQMQIENINHLYFQLSGTWFWAF
jgi:hypothetical protein